MLKAAKEQSGSSWNEKRNMVEGPPALWENPMVTFPKIKKFNNSKASFPLFDALGELYDGHLAEGKHHVTSLEAPEEEEPLEQIQDAEDEPQGFDDNGVHGVHEEDDANGERNEEVLQRVEAPTLGDEESEAMAVESESLAVERRGSRSATPRNRLEKELKRPRKDEILVDMMGSFLEMKKQQVEADAADRAREMEAREREAREKEAREREAREKEASEKEREARERETAQASDFSIRRCISVLDTMEVTKEEKVKSYEIFIKSKDNREAFICACDFDQEAALIWLRSKMS
ncbi:unnamed protein product [Urochloa humidicola]